MSPSKTIPSLGPRTSISTKLRVVGTGNTISPSRSWRMKGSWAISVLIPCFLDPCIVPAGDSEPYQGLLHPEEQHLILAEYYFLEGSWTSLLAGHSSALLGQQLWDMQDVI